MRLSYSLFELGFAAQATNIPVKNKKNNKRNYRWVFRRKFSKMHLFIMAPITMARYGVGQKKKLLANAISSQEKKCVLNIFLRTQFSAKGWSCHVNKFSCDRNLWPPQYLAMVIVAIDNLLPAENISGRWIFIDFVQSWSEMPDWLEQLGALGFIVLGSYRLMSVQLSNLDWRGVAVSSGDELLPTSSTWTDSGVSQWHDNPSCQNKCH